MSDSGHNYDLEEIQDRINRSREQFIEELEVQAVHADRRLVDEFLYEQLGPSEKRSPIAQQEARETVCLIRDFDSHAASIASMVAIAGLELQQTLLSLQAEALENGMEQFGSPGGSAQFAKSTEEISMRAIEFGERIDFVQSLAAAVLLAHRSTISEFTAEALDVRWSDVVSRIRRELANSTKPALFDQSLEQLKKQFRELATDIWEEYLDGLRKYWRTVRRLIGKKNRPKFGQTDLMQRLLHELRQEKRAIAQLETSYCRALELFRSQTSSGDVS